MNREFDKEASQNSHLERAIIVRAQGASEDGDFEKIPTPSKTDSSGCFGIKLLLPQKGNKRTPLVKFFVLFSFLLLLFGCGYHCRDSQDCQNTISVPFIKGDGDGALTSEIIRALSATGHFEYRKDNGNLELQVSIVSESDDRIGYRYDRNPTTGKLRKNIVGTENRETIAVEVKLVDVYSQQVILGPEVISASEDYDYVDSNSIRDLVFFNPHGRPKTVINFSLGQLDSIEGAHDDAQTPIFRKLAQRIVDGLMIQQKKL